MHDGILSTVRGCVQLEAELGTVKAELATRAAAGDGQAVLAAAKEQELLHEHDIAVRQHRHNTAPLLFLLGFPCRLFATVLAVARARARSRGRGFGLGGSGCCSGFVVLVLVLVF